MPVALRFCFHAVFKTGCVFAERIADSGKVTDVYFLADEKLRTILSETLVDAAKLELPLAQRKALRSAHRDYRKNHKKSSVRIELTFSKLVSRRDVRNEWAGDQYERDLLLQTAEPEPQTDLGEEVEVQLPAD